MSMTARLTEERAQAVLNCLSSFRGRNVVPLKQFQMLLGHMESARIASYETTSALATLPVPEVGMGPRYTASRYHPAVSPLPQPLDGPCLSTGRGAPRTSVPAYCCHNRCLQHGLGRYMQWAGSLRALDRVWHINCLELWAVHLALRQIRPLLLGKHVLVRTDNTAAVSYISRLGGIQSHRMSQLARHLLLWSHTQFKSLRAVHIPGKLNRAADALSRQLTFPGEWRLHPETIRLIWSRFGEAQVDLFASPESSHCQLYFSLTDGLQVPSRSPLVPSWDLSIVLAGLQRGPFEPLDSVELKFLSLKTALLTSLTSIKRVRDLQAFSVSKECLVFGPVYSHS